MEWNGLKFFLGYHAWIPTRTDGEATQRAVVFDRVSDELSPLHKAETEPPQRGVAVLQFIGGSSGSK